MEKDDKSNNYSKLNTKTTESEGIINRLKKALSATSDGQLATYLGISRQNIGAARKRNDVPTGWIYKVAEMTGCSMDWLGFGQGPMKMRTAYGEPRPDLNSKIANPQEVYRSRAEVPERTGLLAAGQEQPESFGAAVEMLAKIYNSGDATMIGTISANLRGFCEILERN